MMTIEKPTRWSEWTKLPILALPSVKGYELYEAIRERIEYLFPSTNTEEMPSVLKLMLADFNPNEDYKVMERRMHDAVTELIPRYYNWTEDNAILWNETDLLTALKEDERVEPNPYFLSAKWLKQMFRIVNYLRIDSDIISITWIDEAESGYTSGSTYDEHKAVFENEINFNIAVIQPGGGRSGEIFGSSGKPSNVLYYSCDRDPCSSMAPFIAAFNALKSQYVTTKYTIGLSVDTSGSMHLNTIQPAYNNFVAYLKESYPESRLVEHTASDEDWLIWTKTYIEAEPHFKFEYREEKENV